MVKFGVWVVDLMLQCAVGILNAAGHDRGGVVWLELTLELDLVGFVWPFSVFYVAFFSRLRGCWRGFGGQGCPGRDARGEGSRRQAATRASTTPERRADAGVVSLCHAPTVAVKERNFLGHPPTLFAPLASPTRKLIQPVRKLIYINRQKSRKNMPSTLGFLTPRN